MAGNSLFIPVQEQGWQGGLRNLLRADFGKWFRTRLWWTQSLIWIAVIDGLLAAVLWSGGSPAGLTEGVMLYSIFSAMFPAVAIVIIMQDAIVGEREAGTASWVLSKPVSRQAFVLSKLIPNLVGVLVTMLLIPGILAYAQLSLANGAPLDPLRFLGGIVLLWINGAFYLTLTLMLGTFFTHRAPVIGIPLALAFGQQMLLGLLPVLAKILPWTIAIPFGDQENSIVSALILDRPLPDLTPLYAVVFFIIVFIVVSLWRFEREEF